MESINKYEMGKDNNNVIMWRDFYNEVGEKINNNKPRYCERLLGGFRAGIAPYSQSLTLDALKERDVPCGIQLNSVYIQFAIDLIDQTVEVYSWGHVTLSDEESKKTYMAATGLKDIAKARGVKWMRKSKYKTADDLVKKITTFYENVMEAVIDYTGGYPYKQGIGWVNPENNK